MIIHPDGMQLAHPIIFYEKKDDLTHNYYHYFIIYSVRKIKILKAKGKEYLALMATIKMLLIPLINKYNIQIVLQNGDSGVP